MFFFTNTQVALAASLRVPLMERNIGTWLKDRITTVPYLDAIKLDAP